MAAAADGGGHGQQATSASSHPEPAVQQMEVAQLAEVLYNPALVRGLPLSSSASTLPHFPPHSTLPGWLILTLSGPGLACLPLPTLSAPSPSLSLVPGRDPSSPPLSLTPPP